MRPLKNLMHAYASNQSGATSIEYGVLIAILALGLIAGSNGIGAKITGLWSNLSTDITST